MEDGPGMALRSRIVLPASARSTLKCGLSCAALKPEGFAADRFDGVFAEPRRTRL
jgi:hypothetical protein